MNIPPMPQADLDYLLEGFNEIDFIYPWKMMQETDETTWRRNIKVVNLCKKDISCDNAWIVNSTFQSLMASNRVVVRDCHKLNSIFIATKKGVLFSDCTLNNLKITNYLKEPEGDDAKFKHCKA
jgi:hypothetical protein